MHCSLSSGIHPTLIQCHLPFVQGKLNKSLSPKKREEEKVPLTIGLDWYAATVQGFLLWRYSVMLQPELPLNKVNTVDVILSCWASAHWPALLPRPCKGEWESAVRSF